MFAVSKFFHGGPFYGELKADIERRAAAMLKGATMDKIVSNPSLPLHIVAKRLQSMNGDGTLPTPSEAFLTSELSGNCFPFEDACWYARSLIAELPVIGLTHGLVMSYLTTLGPTALKDADRLFRLKFCDGMSDLSSLYLNVVLWMASQSRSTIAGLYRAVKPTSSPTVRHLPVASSVFMLNKQYPESMNFELSSDGETGVMREWYHKDCEPPSGGLIFPNHCYSEFELQYRYDMTYALFLALTGFTPNLEWVGDPVHAAALFRTESFGGLVAESVRFNTTPGSLYPLSGGGRAPGCRVFISQLAGSVQQRTDDGSLWISVDFPIPDIMAKQKKMACFKNLIIEYNWPSVGLVQRSFTVTPHVSKGMYSQIFQLTEV